MYVEELRTRLLPLQTVSVDGCVTLQIREHSFLTRTTVLSCAKQGSSMTTIRGRCFSRNWQKLFLFSALKLKIGLRRNARVIKWA